MTEYNILNFGAIGDGITDDAAAIQKAIDSCSQNGGGRVTVPSGKTYLSGPFDFKSNVELYVEQNSKILANPDESVYTKSAFRDNPGEGTIWIGGENAENISISGCGTIDGNGVSFMGPEEKGAYILKDFHITDPRPHLLTLVNIKKITIRDVTFQDSAYWCLHLVGCEDVVIDGIRLLNNLKVRNSDGIDPDHCKNVRISNCHIESGDDCICIKNRREYAEFGPCENIVVNNCTMKSTSCAIKLGSENVDVIRNVVFNSCIISSSNRGIGIQHRDEGSVENVTFSNMFIEGRLFDDVWWGKAEPIYVTAYKRASSSDKDSNVRFAEGQTVGKVGKVTNILFSNINCDSENGVFVGGEEGKIQNIKFRNVNLSIGEKTKYKGGIYDLRPSDTVGLLQTETAGFYLSQAQDISIKDCSVGWRENKAPHFNKVLFAENIKRLNVHNLDGQAAKSGSDALDINSCSDLDIRQ